MYWSSECWAAALLESTSNMELCRFCSFNSASADEGNTTASPSQICIRKHHKYTFGEKWWKLIFDTCSSQVLVDHMYRWKLEVLLNSWNPYNYFCFKYSLDDSKAHDGLSLLSWQFWDTFCPQCSIYFGIGMLQRKLTFVIPQTNKTRWKWDNSPPHWFPNSL